jgi:hypothetical protein
MPQKQQQRQQDSSRAVGQQGWGSRRDIEPLVRFYYYYFISLLTNYI